MVMMLGKNEKSPNGMKNPHAFDDVVDVVVCAITVALVLLGTCFFLDYMGILRYMLPECPWFFGGCAPF